MFGRVLMRIVLLLAAAAGLLWPVLHQLSAGVDQGAVYDPVVITTYDAQYVVAADGRLTATEDITAQFPALRHGIFRFWDVVDPADPHARYIPNLVSITMDGRSVPYETYWDYGDRYFVAKIGDPDVYVSPGSHVYRITYTVDGALSPPTAGTGQFVSSDGTNVVAPGSVFFWNVVAQGWQMRMEQARIRIQLPADSGVVQCTAGGTSDGTRVAQRPCEITGAGTREVTLRANSLPANSGMTTRVSLPIATPPRVELPWSVLWDGVLGRSVPAALFVLLLCLVSGALALVWVRSTREEPPGFPVQYAPPPGLGPVETVYIDTEDTGDHALTASLLYLADRRLVTLEHRPDQSWLIRGLTTPDQWSVFDDVSQTLGAKLGVTTPGGWFLADRTKSSGETLSEAQSAIAASARDWGRRSGFVASAPFETWGRVAWLASLPLAVLGFLTWLGPSMWGLPFAVFAIVGLGLLRPGVGRRRTRTGRDLWSRAGGFRRLLSTDSAEDRFDFAARQDLFIAYVPYAVAYGVADRWAEKYRMATGQEPPIPYWYPYAMGYSPYSSGGGFDSFDSTLSASISTYQASQSSSSGGGGGGSFGGGGGGGGGGSW